MGIGGYVSGRVCTNAIRVRREVVESRLLASIKADLLSDEVVGEFERRLQGALCTAPPDASIGRRRSLEAEVSNITDAIAQRLLSHALAERLREAEAEHATLPPIQPSVVGFEDVVRALPAELKRYREMVADLGNPPIEVPRARAVIKDLVGEIQVEPRDGYLVAKMGPDFRPLLGTSICGSGGRI